QMGRPGSAYALESAQKIGPSKDISTSAKAKIGEQRNRVDNGLVDLERDKEERHSSKAAVTKKEKELEAVKEKYEPLQAEINENRKEILRKAKEEAREVLKNANKLVENTISEIKAVNADKEKTKSLRAKLQKSLDKHIEATKKPVKKVVAPQDLPLEVG